MSYSLGQPMPPELRIVLQDHRNRIRQLEAVRAGHIFEVDSTDGGIIVDAPEGPTVFLTSFKPEFCWSIGTIHVDGGSGTGGGTVADIHENASPLSTTLLDYTVPSQLKVFTNGWYQIVANARAQVVASTHEILVGSALQATVLLSSGPAARAQDIANSSVDFGGGCPNCGSGLVANCSIPPVHVQTTDFITLLVGAFAPAPGTPGVNDIDVDVDLWVTLVRPGDPP